MEFLTVKEATKHVGKSESTIKRLLREITGNPDHVDRYLIEPPHDEVERRKEAGEPYVWKISTELLEKRYPPETTSEEGSDDPEKTEPNGAVTDAIVAVLREQLRSKDRQIETLEKQLDRKDEQISNNNERMREQNILMKELQERLAIAPPQKPADIVLDAQAEEGNSQDSTESRKESIWKRNFNLFGRKHS